jgi:hypothetical protein
LLRAHLASIKLLAARDGAIDGGGISEIIVL